MRCEHAFDDGAYVLGALAPAERDAFEKHLAGCADCRAAVASVAVLPGLLGRLSAADAVSSRGVSAEFVAEQRIPRLVKAVTVSRKRERRRLAAVALVLACVTLFAGLAAGSARHDETPVAQPSTVSPSPKPNPSMAPMTVLVSEAGVSAEVAFAESNAGTTITMHCSYAAREDYHRPYLFRLFALGPDGVSEPVGSWMAAPGEEVTLVGTVRLSLGDMTRVELRAKDGRVLLAYDVP